MRQNKKTVSPMSNEGRNQYVVEHITKALLKLMRRQNFSEISISRICGEAGDNKKTPLALINKRGLFWRSGRDSNPRAIARKLISSQPRYDHFDTAAFELN